MRRKLIHGTIAVVVGTACALPAYAQVKPDVLVKQRQSAMVLQGKYFYGHLRPTAQGKMPYDASSIARDVGYLDALSKMPWDGFTPATKDVKSAALPAVFSDTAKFKEAQDQYRAEMVKLVAVVAKGGDEAAVKAQILAVNKGCDGCHEDFRQRN